ncbi:MAG: cytochrome o ubiquinol oxidase subunit I, partial [Aquabacterium sp.]|nr:cytochrome o ubiquinol oxidase subunit I [Aquabacterium sp.]
MNHFDDPSLQIWFQIAAVGAGIVALGIGAFGVQLLVSYLKRDQLRDETGDIWGGRTLEWSTASPPPDYNFAFTPIVHDNDAWHDMKQRGAKQPMVGFKAIHMPKNTASGFVIAMLATGTGFALIWHMWLFAGLGFVATIAASIAHTFNYDRDFYIPADEVARSEHARAGKSLASAA